jgi:hypothetical protein
MSPRFLFLAILAGILLSPAVHAALPFQQTTQTDNSRARPGVDPIGPPAYDGAVMLRELTLEESTQQAGLIIVGRVQTQTARKVPGSIVTDITVQVEKQIKGTAAPSSNVTFTVQGGIIGSERLYVGGQPFFVNGERVLLFLRSNTDRQLVQMYTSRYSLAGANAVQPEGHKTLAIAEVERRVSAAKGGEAVQIGASANQAVTSAPFTAFCIPWTAGQMPVPYRVNDGSGGGASAPGGNAVAGLPQFNVIEQALAMWQTLGDSATAFQVVHSISTATGLNHDDFENTVAWADINSVDGGGPGVIGLNFCSVNGGGRHDADTLLSNNSAWQWDQFPDNGITSGQISVKAVLAHELGHGLGLDHSDINNSTICQGQGFSTPTMCSSIVIGQDKFIQPDDQAGAASLYPLSGAAPGAPSALSVTQSAPTSNTLTWTGASGSKFAYQIDRATPDCNSTFRPLNSVAGTSTTYVDNNYGQGLPANTPYCYRIKALGAGGDSAFSNNALSVAQCPVTATAVWPPNVQPGTPAYQDFGAYELGMKFRSDVTGNVCGVKFYKGIGNTGTHIARLWSAGGTLLASATYVSETATGWQNVAFATPVAIAANTTYVVSYTDPAGRFSYDANYFNVGYDNGVLHAPTSGSVGGNGVVGNVGAFPTSNANGGNFWVDPLFVPDATPSSCTGTTRTTFAQASQPQTLDYPDTTSLTLGAKFRADVPGIVCAVRFYKGAGNIGTHTGQVWTANGVLLGSVTFTGETASGWQQANFAQPLQIAANTTYIISYTAPNGHFSYSQGQLTNSGVDNPPLHILSTSAGGGNGVYSFGATFPNQVSAGNNFWVDLVFQANAGLCGTSTMSVFSSSSTPATAAYPDPNSYEVGVKFVSDVAGQVCGVRFYKGSGNSGTHVGRLWSSDGTQLSTATFTNETATGWQQVLFSQPVQIVANVTYIVSYSDPTGRFSFNTGQLNTSIDNAPLHLPANGQVGGNAVVAFGAGNFPTVVSAGNNFWVDLVFAPGSSSGGLPDSCTAGSSSVFLSTSTPGTAAYPDSNPYEFGMRFRPDVNGAACGVRFYKGAGNNGAHTGRLWTNNGVQLATVAFTGETASGWQQAFFSQPVQLTAGTTYVVSYTDPQGNFAFDANTFAGTVNNGILHAPVGAAQIGNPGTFPNSQSNNNFWVDVLFAPTCPCSVWSPAYIPTTTAHPDPNSYEFGLRFKPDQNGFITGVRFYKGAGNDGPHFGRLWRADGALLAQAQFTSESASGWQQVSFSTPVFVGAGTTYVVSYGDPTGHFSIDTNYFTVPIESGPFTVFSNGQGGNNVYGSLGSFPSAASGNNFWVDAVWTANCLGCLTVQSAPISVAPAKPVPPPPGSGRPAPQTPAGTAPPGSQEIKPPPGEPSQPPIPTPTPAPGEPRGRDSTDNR